MSYICDTQWSVVNSSERVSFSIEMGRERSDRRTVLLTDSTYITAGVGIVANGSLAAMFDERERIKKGELGHQIAKSRRLRSLRVIKVRS